MNRKLEKILHRDYMGILNKAQALELLELYLDEMRRELNRQIDDYCDNKLSIRLADNASTSISLISNAFQRRYSKTQIEVANRFSRFRIANGKHFIDFIKSINRELVDESINVVARELVQKIDSLKLEEELCSEDRQLMKEIVSVKMVSVNSIGGRRLRELLNTLYT